MSALIKGCNYLQLSMIPDFFDGALFAQARGQLAYQSLWWSTRRDPSCTVCGDSPVDPSEIRLKSPDTKALNALFEDMQSCAAKVEQVVC